MASGAAGFLHIRRTSSGARVTRAFARSPLRLLTPRNHGSAAWVFTSTFGGGLVDGDALALDVVVDPGAAALLSTQSATKVYVSPRGTSSVLRARVGSGGLLVIAPDPVVCFAGARFRQHQLIDLERGASLVVIDWLTAGRRARGERWAFDDYTSVLSVRVDGVLALHDILSLRSEDGDLLNRMGRFDVLATVLVMGEALHAHAQRLVASLAEAPLGRRADELVAASALPAGGVLLRLAGRSTEALGAAIAAHLGFLPDLLGDDYTRRKR